MGNILGAGRSERLTKTKLKMPLMLEKKNQLCKQDSQWATVLVYLVTRPSSALVESGFLHTQSRRRTHRS